MSIKYAVTVPARRTHIFTLSYGQIKHALMAEIRQDKRYAEIAGEIKLNTHDARMEVNAEANFSITISIPEKS